MVLEILFWLAAGLTIYTYAGYPLVLMLLRLLRRKRERPKSTGSLPVVSMVISVYNEEEVVPGKLKNILEIDYPSDSIEILIGSDGSSDGTDSLLQSAQVPNLRVYCFPERRGKAPVLNELVKAAKGDVIVFSDANTMYTPQAVRHLVSALEDPHVGAVCGELVLGTGQRTVGEVGETSYWGYETFLKRIESDVQTTIGATGGVYALRKELYVPLSTWKVVTDDFVIPARALERGRAVRYEPRAIAFEDASGSVGGEFQRKVRIGASNFSGLDLWKRLLHPRYGFVAFALWSHKVLRWCVPFFMIVMVCCSLLLAQSSPFFQIIVAGGILFLLLATVGFVAEHNRARIGVVGLPYYLIAMNAALFVGFVRYVTGRQQPTWKVDRER